MNTITSKVPVWFWVISIILLLWNLMGVSSFIYHSLIMTGEALQTLPKKEQILYTEYSMWIHIVFAIAVFSALLANVFLLAKMKAAKLLFIISLVAVIVQMFHNLFMTSTVEVYGTQAYVMPVFILVVALFSIWFTEFCIKKGWIKSRISEN